ncbi:unnamed protein product [Chrysodeixis includens]|uniref:Uncharacterized protein n=1 Tax=Chrysodeixis includens TaxID=689277 RepID=A0A9N8KSA1_CHRIL|nr:unnamed protein product [Chrysodeixis includens]
MINETINNSARGQDGTSRRRSFRISIVAPAAPPPSLSAPRRAGQCYGFVSRSSPINCREAARMGETEKCPPREALVTFIGRVAAALRARVLPRRDRVCTAPSAAPAASRCRTPWLMYDYTPTLLRHHCVYVGYNHYMY